MDIFIKEKNKQGNGYVGYINRKVTFVNFKFPEPFTGIGHFNIDQSLLIDKGNYNILNKIILPNPLIIEGGIKIYKNVCTCWYCQGYEVEGYKYKTGGRNPSAIFYDNSNYKVLQLSFYEIANEFIDENSGEYYIDVFNTSTKKDRKIKGRIIYSFKDSIWDCSKVTLDRNTIIYREDN